MFVGSEKIAEVKVPYSIAPEVAASYVAKKGPFATGTAYDLSNGITINNIAAGTYTYTGVHAGEDKLKIDPAGTASNSATTEASDTYTIMAVDQYGLSNFDFAFGSTKIVDGTSNGTSTKADIRTALFADAGTVTLSGTKTETFKIETKDASYKQVLTHVSGSIDVTITTDGTAEDTNTAFTYTDQTGKAYAGTLTLSNANMAAGTNNAGNATIGLAIKTDGKLSLTVTAAPSNKTAPVPGDKWTRTGTIGGVSVLFTAACTKTGTSAANNATSEWTVTAKYN